MSPLEKVDLALDELERSNIAFNTPREIRLGETSTIELRLSPSDSVEELTVQIEESGQEGQIQSAEQVLTSGTMRARLTGRDFKIEALSDETQAISYREPTIWRWEIEPTEAGEKKLHLSLSAEIEIEEESSARLIESFVQTIPVIVTINQRLSTFVGNNWQWLWATVLVPIGSAGLVAWKRWKKRKDLERFVRAPR